MKKKVADFVKANEFCREIPSFDPFKGGGFNFDNENPKYCGDCGKAWESHKFFKPDSRHHFKSDGEYCEICGKEKFFHINFFEDDKIIVDDTPFVQKLREGFGDLFKKRKTGYEILTIDECGDPLHGVCYKCHDYISCKETDDDCVWCRQRKVNMGSTHDGLGVKLSTAADDEYPEVYLDYDENKNRPISASPYEIFVECKEKVFEFVSDNKKLLVVSTGVLFLAMILAISFIIYYYDLIDKFEFKLVNIFSKSRESKRRNKRSGKKGHVSKKKRMSIQEYFDDLADSVDVRSDYFSEMMDKWGIQDWTYGDPNGLLLRDDEDYQELWTQEDFNGPWTLIDENDDYEDDRRYVDDKKRRWEASQVELYQTYRKGKYPGQSFKNIREMQDRSVQSHKGGRWSKKDGRFNFIQYPRLESGIVVVKNEAKTQEQILEARIKELELKLSQKEGGKEREVYFDTLASNLTQTGLVDFPDPLPSTIVDIKPNHFLEIVPTQGQGQVVNEIIQPSGYIQTHEIKENGMVQKLETPKSIKEGRTVLDFVEEELEHKEATNKTISVGLIAPLKKQLQIKESKISSLESEISKRKKSENEIAHKLAQMELEKKFESKEAAFYKSQAEKLTELLGSMTEKKETQPRVASPITQKKTGQEVVKVDKPATSPSKLPLVNESFLKTVKLQTDFDRLMVLFLESEETFVGKDKQVFQKKTLVPRFKKMWIKEKLRREKEALTSAMKREGGLFNTDKDSVIQNQNKQQIVKNLAMPQEDYEAEQQLMHSFSNPDAPEKEVSKTKEPSREAKVKHQEWFDLVESSPFYNKQGRVFCGDTQLGWFTILDVSLVGVTKTLVLLPQHFWSMNRGDDFLTITNMNKQQSQKIFKKDFRGIIGLDMCICIASPQQAGMLSHVKLSEEIKNFDTIRGALKMHTERDGKLRFTITQDVPSIDAPCGEVLYFCESDRGDCGAPVYNGNQFVGMHVGTDGEDKGNRFVFLCNMQRQAIFNLL